MCDATATKYIRWNGGVADNKTKVGRRIGSVSEEILVIIAKRAVLKGSLLSRRSGEKNFYFW